MCGGASVGKRLAYTANFQEARVPHNSDVQRPRAARAMYAQGAAGKALLPAPIAAATYKP